MLPAKDRALEAPRGFTLIELLAVITVIGILIGLVFKLAFFADDEQSITKAKEELMAFDTALYTYARPVSRNFPQTEGLSDEKQMNARFFMALTGLTDSVGELNPENNPSRNYLSISSLEIKVEGSISYVVDPWDNPYVYRSPPPPNTKEGFLIFSKGPDGRASTDTDGAPEDDIDNIYPGEN